MKTDVYENEATTTTNSTRAGAQSGSGKPDTDQAEMMKKWKPPASQGPVTRRSTPW